MRVSFTVYNMLRITIKGAGFSPLLGIANKENGLLTDGRDQDEDYRRQRNKPKKCVMIWHCLRQLMEGNAKFLRRKSNLEKDFAADV